MNITTERIDDFPLLLEVMKRLGLPGIIDNHLRRHGLQQGLSWGWIATIWLAHILAQSNPRKLPVQSWVRQAHETIERITGMKVNEMDFTDDRLTLLLRRLSKPETWQAIETELGRNILRVYELKPERVRLDATTVSSYHASGEGSLFQYGHSKDDPSLAQVKVMVAALDPLGLPLFVAGPKVTAEIVVKALEALLPPELEYLISDQGVHFRTMALAQLAERLDFIWVPIARHRAQSNGIAERFVRTLKEWLADKAWQSSAELADLLVQFLLDYNDRPHQGLPIPGLSPNEFAKRIWLM